MPAVSFVATANAVRYCAAEPHFVDVEPEHFGICPESLEKHLDSIADQEKAVTIGALAAEFRRLCRSMCLAIPVKSKKLWR